MPLIPGTSQLPLTPNKQWLYIAHPYTDNILGNTANEDSLLCYAYSQGYTGLFLYQMNYYKNGGYTGNTFTASASTIFQNFIQKAYTLYNIEVGAAFGNISTVEAISTYNASVLNNVTKSFSAVISEIEWWNFSYNCPFQKPGSTGANGEGAYSAVDTIKSFQDNYALFSGAGLKLYTYNGWTKPADYEYTSGFEVIDSGPDYVTIKGNYTNGGPAIDDNLPSGSKTFQANQVIRIDNFPASGQHSLYKLHATTPTVLVAGNTQLKLASGSNNGRVIVGNAVNTVTGISGANNGTIVSKWVSTYTDGGGNVISELFLKTSANHNLTSGSAIIYNTVPPFTGLGPQIATTRGADNTGTGSPLTTSGTTIKVLSPTLPIISSVQALSGTAVATCSIAHGLQTGDQVLISGISLTGFAGTKTVTVLNTTEFEYSAPAAPNTPQTSTPGGAFKVTTMATQASPRLVTPNGTYQANFPVTGKVRLMFEVKSTITGGIGNPIGIVLRGNKLAFLQNGITYGSGSYVGSEGYRATRLKIADRTGATTNSISIEGTDVPPLSNPYQPIYDSPTNTTILFVPFATTLGTSLIPGFCEGMVNLDIVAEEPHSPSSELQQFANNTTVDVYALHDYVSTPNYNYVQSRTIELGNASSPVVVPTKISWIISSESSFSQAYFEGKASVGGAVLYPPKTPIDAYKYISVPLINPQPAQSSPISTETDTGVQANINVDGVVIFKDDLIRALVSGDGPRIYVNCGPDVTVTTSPGSVPLTVKVCDDCIPAGATYTVTWSIVSQPGGGVITGGTFTTNSCALTTNSSAALNYSNSGTYLLRATVTESNGTSVGQDEVSIRVGTANDPLFVSIINEGSEPTCSNNAELATLTATASNPFGVSTAITAPVTFVWSGPNGYSTTTTDNVPPGFTSTLNPPPAVGVYTVVATDAAGRTGTFTYTLNSQHDLSQVFSLNTYPVSCSRGSDGYAEAIFTPYAIANNYCNLDVAYYSNFQFYWTRGGAVGLPFGNNTTSPLNSGTISVTIIDCNGCSVTLTGTISSPTPVGLTATATSSANCGQSSGSISWSASGGTPPYLYYIYNSSSTLIYNGTNTSLSNLPADVYTVVVQDDNACGRVDTVEIVASGSALEINWVLSPPAEVCSCQEFTLEVQINKLVSGPGPYVINWSPTPTSTTIVVPDDTYSASFIFDCTNPGSAGIVPIQVQVTDATGCSASLSTTVQVNAPVTPVTSITQIFHPGSLLTSCTGSYVELYIQGGTGVDGNWYLDENPAPTSSDPNYYNDDAVSGQTIDLAWWDANYSGWIPGNTAVLTWIEYDVNGCESSASTTIVAPQVIDISTVITAVPCKSPSPNVGEIDLTVLTGCPPYTYSWTGPGGFSSSAEDITAVITGTYTVEITDSSGNIGSFDIFVPVSSPEIDDVIIINNCFGGSQTNGKIEVIVSGGQPPYSYSWTSSTYPSFSSTSSEPKNLGNGSYTVVVTDAYDCSTTATYVISNEVIEIDYEVFEPSCWADCNGIIVLDEKTLDNYDIYEIAWYSGSYPHGTLITNSGQIGIKGLCVGTYSVVVTTTSGCKWVKEFSLGTNFNPTLFTYNVVNLGAGETNTGAIYINTVTGGGGPPYDFEWSGPDGYTNNTKDITDLEAGSYTVTIYTGKSCYVTKTFVISTTCPDLSVDELKTALFKFQCCAGILAKQYVQLINVGREDLSDCKITDLKYLTLAIDALSCIEELPDPSLSCEDISNILNQMSKICSCDCCSNGNGNYNVTYNPVTGQLDTQGFNNLIPEYPPAGSGGTSGGSGGSTGGGTTVITT